MPGQAAARQLATERQRLGLTRAETARALGVDRSTVAHWERGYRPVPESALRRLATTKPAADRVLDRVRREPGLSEPELRRVLDKAERRWLPRMLSSGRLVLRTVVRTDTRGRKIVGNGVYPGGEGWAARRGTRQAAGSGGSVDLPTVTGQQLGDARRYAGISTETVAGRLGTTGPSIGVMEARTRVPPARVLELVDALGLPNRVTPAAIRRARRAAGWSQEDLAGRLGSVSQELVAKWETRRAPVPRSRMLALAAALFEAETRSPAAIEAATRELTERQIAEVAAAGKAGIGRAELLTKHGAARLGAIGTRVDGADALAEALRTGRLVERLTTVEVAAGGRPGSSGSGAGRASAHLTLRRLFVPSAAPSGPARRLSGAEVRTLRVTTYASQADLARELGTKPANVSGWENRGEKPVPLYWDAPLREALARLAEASPEAMIRALVGSRPGITARGVRGELGQAARLRRALQAMVRRGELVKKPARDAIGKIQQGLYLPDQYAPPVKSPWTGAHLRAMRRKAGWRVEDVAHELGVDARSLRRAETRERLAPELADRYRAVVERPAPRRTGRRPSALAALLLRLEREGEIPMAALRHSMTVDLAIEGGHAHVEEHPTTNAAGRKIMRRMLIAGPHASLRANPAEPIDGQELRSARTSAGLTQAALAGRLGLSHVTVSAWERRGVPAAWVAAVHAAFGPDTRRIG